MALKKITPHRFANRILTGHFQEKIGYSTYRPQGTADWLLIYTIRGSGEFGFAPKGSDQSAGRVIASPGDAMLLSQGAFHDYQVHAPVKRWEFLWAHFHPRPEWLTLLDWPEAQAGYPDLLQMTVTGTGARKTIQESLTKMHRLAISAHRLRELMAMNALEEALLWFSTEDARDVSAASDVRVSQAQEYLCQHLRDNVTLDELAEVVGLSVSRLSHVFRRQTGLTPQRYYELQRLERARQLLELTAMPIKQISNEVGFASPFYFTLRFKRHTGKSPRQYRSLK